MRTGNGTERMTDANRKEDDRRWIRTGQEGDDMAIYNLERFKEAQRQPVDGQRTAVRELLSGRKTGHWIWYILPQLAELGTKIRFSRYAHAYFGR